MYGKVRKCVLFNVKAGRSHKQEYDVQVSQKAGGGFLGPPATTHMSWLDDLCYDIENEQVENGGTRVPKNLKLEDLRGPNQVDV